MKISKRQLRRIIKEALGYRSMSSNRLQNWSDIKSNYPEFYDKAEVAFQGYDGDTFDGLSLQDFIKSIDPEWLASKPLTSATWLPNQSKYREGAQLEAVLLSIVRPSAAEVIPNIEELRNMYKVK